MDDTEFVQTIKFDYPDEKIQINAKLHGMDLTVTRFKNFLKKIDGIDPNNPIFKSNRCYMWTGAIANPTLKGGQHGNFNAGNNKIMKAHRIMYMLCNGIPHVAWKSTIPCPCGKLYNGRRKQYRTCCGPVVMHKCIECVGKDSNGRCVNPFHLKLGTHSENQRDIYFHGTGRGKISQGELHGRATMTDEKARAVWEDVNPLNKTLTHEQIAVKHGVSKNIVKDMSRGKTWNHITGISTAKREAGYVRRNKRRAELPLSNLYRTKASNIKPKQMSSDILRSLQEKRRKVEEYKSIPPVTAALNGETKKCGGKLGCGRTLSLNHFNKKKSTKDGYHYMCRECQSKDNKKWAKQRGPRKSQLSLTARVESGQLKPKPILPPDTPKVCRGKWGCGRQLTVSEFAFKNKKARVYFPCCKECRRKKQRIEYHQKKQKQIIK